MILMLNSCPYKFNNTQMMADTIYIQLRYIDIEIKGTLAYY